jgi:signal peptidase I
MSSPMTESPESPETPASDEADGAEKSSTRTRSIIEWVVVIAGALIVALLIKAFLIQAFYIPSESMVPTLKIGDRVLVNKLSYNAHDVNRGDLVVFERPPGETDQSVKDLIKRVVGLPGDAIVIKDNAVYVNGTQLDEGYLPEGTITKQGRLDCEDASPCMVPDDSVWVMGDNREHSYDSRYFGTIKENTIVGRAFLRIWPLGSLGFL